MTLRLGVVFLLIFGTFAVSSQAQVNAQWADTFSFDYVVVPNVTYSTENNTELKADIYQPRRLLAPNPVILAIHGGGLVSLSREHSLWMILPFLQMGYSVVNIDYRLASNAHAPAAVEDARCALYWVAANAKKYNFDSHKIITMGASSGGHLALITAMLRPADGFDYGCHSTINFSTDKSAPAVAAVISLWGVTDEYDSLMGPDAQKWAQVWIGSQAQREQLAKSVSPVYHVRPGLPPILLIHGTDDRTVPYAQAVHLHRELDQDQDPNQLLRLPGGGHGAFTKYQWELAWSTIRTFLKKYNLLPQKESVAN